MCLKLYQKINVYRQEKKIQNLITMKKNLRLSVELYYSDILGAIRETKMITKKNLSIKFAKTCLRERTYGCLYSCVFPFRNLLPMARRVCLLLTVRRVIGSDTVCTSGSHYTTEPNHMFVVINQPPQCS